MKAISLWQPFASLLASGLKRIETRSWELRCRLPLTLAIHAAKKWTPELAHLCLAEPFDAALGSLNLDARSLPKGAIVGVVRIVECCDTVGLASRHGPYPPRADVRERAFGDYSPGRFGWVCDTFRPLKQPVPCVGRQSLFDLPADVLAAVEAQVGSEP